MIRAARLFVIVMGVGLALLLCLILFFERVPPAAIGVKVSMLGGGVEEKDYEMGYHVGVTGLHEWKLLDARTHFLTYARQRGRGQRAEERPALDIRTKDNNTAYFDVTLTYRIKRGEGHQIVMAGNQLKYRSQADTAVQAVLRAELAQLASEEIYDTDMRLAVVGRAMPKLVEAMADYHLEPESLLLRAVTFPEAYETKLRQKQLTRQQKRLEESKRKVEEQRGSTDVYAEETKALVMESLADWDKTLQQARSDNEIEVTSTRTEAKRDSEKMRAEAEADYETAIAEGQLAVEKAEALRNELRNQALDTLGGRIHLAQQAAQNLQFESVTLNSNDPSVPSVIDLEALVRLLVGTQEEAGGD